MQVGADAWRRDAKRTLHRSNKKGRGFRGIHKRLTERGIHISAGGFRELCSAAHARRKSAARYRELFQLKLRKRARTEDMRNHDSHTQNSQYAQYDRTAIVNSEHRGQCPVVMAQRDDHAEGKSNTAALTNQHAELVRAGVVPGQPTHDYVTATQTHVQATATYIHASGDAPSIETVFVKALSITPSTATQLMNDLYRSVEKHPEQFRMNDGTIKPWWHFRVDGGSNESKETYYNQILWTEFCEIMAIEVLLLTHRESGGNVKEFIERMNGQITEHTNDWLIHDEDYDIIDADTGAICPTKLDAKHIAIAQTYSDCIDQSPSLHDNSVMHAELSSLSPAALAPRDLYERDAVWKEIFAAKPMSKRRKDQLQREHPIWWREAARLRAICEAHKKDKFGRPTEGRYVFCGEACHKASCPSKHCNSILTCRQDGNWCSGGPPAGCYPYPTYDPDRIGHYLTPHAAMSRLCRGEPNTPDSCLPSILLPRERAKLINGDKSAMLTMEQCHQIANIIKDVEITPEYVHSYNMKQRSMHLRRVAGAQKATQTRQRNALVRANDVVVGGQVEYSVERITNKRWHDEKERHEYYVKWKDHSPDENTWCAPLITVLHGCRYCMADGTV